MESRFSFSLYAAPLVRVGVALVFLLLGIDQLQNPEAWAVLPSWFVSLITPFESPLQFITMNGVLDIVLGSMLLLGLFTRTIAALMALHLCGVLVIVGYNDVAVRDLGILLAALSVAFHGRDTWCLDALLRKQRNS